MLANVPSIDLATVLLKYFFLILNYFFKEHKKNKHVQLNNSPF